MVAFTIVTVPCAVSPAGLDPFRAPKEYFLRGSAVLIGAFVVLALADRGRTARIEFWRFCVRLQRPLVAAILALSWTLITAVTSTVRPISVTSAIYVASASIFFLGTCLAVHRRRLVAVYAFLLPAVVNVGALLLEELRIWDIYGELDRPSHRTALLGNPNDLGMFLLAPAVAALAVSHASSRRRGLHLFLAGILGLGMLLTQSMTAIAAYSLAVVVMSMRRSGRKALVTLAGVGLVLLIASATYPAFRVRVKRLRTAVATRDYNTLTSYRLTPVVAGWQMFQKHPLLGVGPGCYGFHYFQEKIIAEARHPLLWQSADRVYSFEQAHNDFIQSLAVSGLPGLGILIAALALVGSLSTRRGGQQGVDFRVDFSGTYSLPLAAGAAVLMTAQFPLELAASTVSLLYGAALCCSWEASSSDA